MRKNCLDALMSRKNDAEFELNYAKQSQFQKSTNGRKWLFTKGL
jgi:hypothetical protein